MHQPGYCFQPGYYFNLSKYLKQKVINSFSLNPGQENEIRKIVNNLSLNKSTVLCRTLTIIFKKHVDVLKQALSYLTNFSFR